MFADAHRQSQQSGLVDDHLHLIGRSLGSAVITQLAANVAAASVTLITPLKSVAAIGQQIFPWLPVSSLLADHFDLISHARTIETPLLAVIAGRDEVIPNRHSYELYEAWKGPKQQLLVAQADHNSVTGFAECPTAMAGFLQAHGWHYVGPFRITSAVLFNSPTCPGGNVSDQQGVCYSD